MLMKLIIGNPFDYNTISLKNSKYSIGEHGPVKKEEPTPTQTMVINDPLCNFVGKYFGIQSKADWAKYYDLVNEITLWARQKSGSNDLNKVITAISERLNSTPALNEKRIVDFHIQTKLDRIEKPSQDYNGNIQREVKE